MKVVFDHEMLSFWNWKLDKCSSSAIYLIIAPRYFLEHITFSYAKNKSLNQTAGPTNDLLWCFKKNERFSASKEKLVCEASRMSCMKNTAH